MSTMNATAIDFLLPSPAGFFVDDAASPAARDDVPTLCRERAALLVLAITRGATPEDLAAGLPAAAWKASADPLERAEALAWVDLLADALVPRSADA